jgi:hypothetical protein
MEHIENLREQQGERESKEKEQMNKSKRKYGILEDLNNRVEGSMRRSS